MSDPLGDRGKIKATHLARLAFVYVRQSSPQQVRTNVESKRRQYDFAAQAEALGWSRDRIVLIDEDQGRSGTIPYVRPGFGQLVSAVARGEGGIAMSLELSRLARNDPDWHHLVYLCRWTETLIADEHGIFDPTASADRLVLGIRGQVSELERDNAVHRMVEARWSKARRGEAFTIPPAGYELDERGALVVTPDEAVQAALARVFQKFDELGTARQVYLWWREEGLPFPVRRLVPRVHPVVWGAVSYRLILQTLHHPIYTGAYVFGRSETRRELDPESQRLVVRHVKRKQWPVLIKDHHLAYISFAQYVQNQERLRDNEAMGPRTDESHRGAAREGRALLQGLVRCGHCGRRMHVGYGGVSAARTLQYRCSRVRVLHLGPECQLVGGKRIEATVVEAFLEATEEAGPAAAAFAGERVRAELEATERTWRLQIEQAEYEVQRAERQYNAVEPEHRTVARELERRWNERLVALDALRTRAAAARADPTSPDRGGGCPCAGPREPPRGGLARADDDGARPQAPAPVPDRRGPAAHRGAAPLRAHRLEGWRGHRSRGRALRARRRRGPAHRRRHRRARAQARRGLRRRPDRAHPQPAGPAQRPRAGVHAIECTVAARQAAHPAVSPPVGAGRDRGAVHRRRGRTRARGHDEHDPPLAPRGRPRRGAGHAGCALAHRT